MRTSRDPTGGLDADGVPAARAIGRLRVLDDPELAQARGRPCRGRRAARRGRDGQGDRRGRGPGQRHARRHTRRGGRRGEGRHGARDHRGGLMAVSAVPRTEQLELSLLQMQRIRAFEAKAMELFQEKLIRGSVHPYTGMEAIAVGVCSALGEHDYITSTHRGHGHSIAKGLDLKLMMAEITGRATGYCGGKGGSMHITAMRHGMLGADAIVAGSLAIATGAAYALRLQGKDAVVVSFFGDGASNQGIFHESANLASVLAAPVIYVCENNQWAISTPFQDAVNVPDVAVRANGYGFPGVVVDGNDFFAVREAAERAVARARAGDGPTLIEAKSYRITPHSAATPNDNRPPEELDLWRARDPIVRFAEALVEQQLVSAERVAEIEAEAVREVEEATEFALASPYPDPEAAVTDVYAPGEWNADGRLR